ncbi:hypothetical protein V1527DRAFT_35709 [Lipomyces starkeyi]
MRHIAGQQQRSYLAMAITVSSVVKHCLLGCPWRLYLKSLKYLHRYVNEGGHVSMSHGLQEFLILCVCASSKILGVIRVVYCAFDVYY